MTIDYIDALLSKFFQKDISLFLGNEEMKKGKFIIFESTVLSNNFYIDLHILTDKKTDIVRIPYPFAIEEHEEDDLFYFDYRISALAKNKKLEKQIIEFTSTVEESKNNKFLNKILEIQFS